MRPLLDDGDDDDDDNDDDDDDDGDDDDGFMTKLDWLTPVVTTVLLPEKQQNLNYVYPTIDNHIGTDIIMQILLRVP